MMNVKQDPRIFELMPPCWYCKHLSQSGTLFNADDPDNSLEGWVCPAFPEGIPAGILLRAYPHNTPNPGAPSQVVYESEEYEFDGEKQLVTFDGEWVPAE